MLCRCGAVTMKTSKQKLTLDRRVTYQIKVPGELNTSWSDWVEGMTIAVESGGDGEGNSYPITILTVTLDQAALQGVLRRLYSLGLPLISVACVECDSKDGSQVVDRCL